MSLSVLVYGDDPFDLFLAWRFSLAKSIELCVVGSKYSQDVTVRTRQYGNGGLQVDPTKVFMSVGDLLDSRSNAGFDLVFVNAAASSLHALSKRVNEVLPLFNNTNTKLVINESSAINLQKFVTEVVGTAIPHHNIFGYVTDYDLRFTIDSNSIQHYTKAGNVKLCDSASDNSILLGSTDIDQRTGGYTTHALNLLQTFTKLFSKLLPNDTISDCNNSYQQYQTSQWSFAIPKICLEPLLIILEELNPTNLSSHILSKPLITGLINEVITIASRFGVQLPQRYSSETEILNSWPTLFQNQNTLPTNVHYFAQGQNKFINFDVVLLQPILLADDLNIKTPYLEFLYTMIRQYQILNAGKSIWFQRSDTNQKSSQNEQLLEEKLQKLNEELAYQQNYAKELSTKLDQEEKKHQDELNALKARLKELETQSRMTNTSNSRGSVMADDTLSQPISKSISESRINGLDNMSYLKEKELELKRKELELQERELSMKKKSLSYEQPQTTNPQQYHMMRKQKNNSSSRIPDLGNNIPISDNRPYSNGSVNNNPYYNNSRISSGHSIPSASTNVMNNYVGNNNSAGGYPQGHFNSNVPLKTTSRKNRPVTMHSFNNVPGYTSNDYGGRMMGNYSTSTSQSRFNSLSSNTMPMMQGPNSNMTTPRHVSNPFFNGNQQPSQPNQPKNMPVVNRILSNQNNYPTNNGIAPTNNSTAITSSYNTLPNSQSQPANLNAYGSREPIRFGNSAPPVQTNQSFNNKNVNDQQGLNNTSNQYLNVQQPPSSQAGTVTSESRPASSQSGSFMNLSSNTTAQDVASEKTDTDKKKKKKRFGLFKRS